MKKSLPLLLTAAMSMVACYVSGQHKTFWSVSSEPPPGQERSQARTIPSAYTVFELDFAGLKNELQKAPVRGAATRTTTEITVSFPNSDGELQQFKVTEASVLHPDLAAKYPGIKSFAGQGVDDPSASIRFSISDEQGFHGMVTSPEKSTYYIDPLSTDLKYYSIYKRQSLSRAGDFQCLTKEEAKPDDESRNASAGRTNDKKLRKYRLALSCNAEYGNKFAGTGTNEQKKARILAQMNVTMTRVNGIYERDLAITMEIVSNNDRIIYFGNTGKDPWNGEFNDKTQQVIDAAIGTENYDIGHNFNTSGGGNAGCIGCVCVNGSKGSGYTGRANPTGDAFDIDYVAHEMGHQFGGYHTQSNANCISGSGTTEVEPGSGSTIMGYAGICEANVQNSSDAYFHYVNIRDISKNVQSGVSASCAQVIPLTNKPPVANAGPDYIIPKSTAFVLRGQGSDPDGDALTYTWEQNDPENPNTTSNDPPAASKTKGPLFRSREGTGSAYRFFPQLSDVVDNNLQPEWEVIPAVGRTLNFALTVRDNKAGGGQSSDDLMRVTVNGTAGPFVVSAPNTAVTWAVGSAQTVTWSVAKTNVSPVNCQKVNILLSTDGGFTYPVTLLTGTPNDGSQNITVPNTLSSKCRIKVEATGNIFYDISNTNFTIGGNLTCKTTVPSGITTSAITADAAVLSWNSVSPATYEVRYRKTGTTAWAVKPSSTNSITLTGLTLSTSYQVQIRSKCSKTSAYSPTVSFTTASTTYCAAKGNSVTDEFIGRVQIGMIDNTSGSNKGYGSFVSMSTDLNKGSAYSLTITPGWTGSAYTEGYGMWIDYNKDGDFSDAGEQVWTRSPSKAAPVIAGFTVPSNAATGPTRMRISMKYNGMPSACESFGYGEVEDYTVNIKETGAGLCTSVILALNLDNYPEETNWDIKNASGAVVASGGNYKSSAATSTVTSNVCLTEGCYTFTINDAFGDGMCCNYGNGSYTLKDASGKTLASGGTFSSSKAHNVCIGTKETSRGEEFVMAEITPQEKYIYPNPVKDRLSVRVADGTMIKAISIVSMQGTIVKTAQSEKEIDVSSLQSGMYILTMQTDRGIKQEKFVKE